MSVLQGIPYYITVFRYVVWVVDLLVLLFDFLLFIGHHFSGEGHVEHPTKKTTRRVLHMSVGARALVFLLLQVTAMYGLLE